MVWARLDDKTMLDEKLVALSDGAYRLWVMGLVYCNTYLTDGFIPEAVLCSFGVRANIQECADELCRACRPGSHALWTHTSGGFLIHDFLQRNVSRETVLAARGKAKERMALARAGRVPTNTARTSPEVPTNTTHTSPEVQGKFADSSPNPIPIPIKNVLARAARSREPEAEEKPTGPLQQAIDHYHALFLKRTKKKPHITGKVPKLLKQLIEEQGLDDVLQALTAYFEDSYAGDAGYDIGLFVGQFNRYRAAPPVMDEGEALAAETRRLLDERDRRWAGD